jgi:hypothetical protein
VDKERSQKVRKEERLWRRKKKSQKIGQEERRC